MIILPMTSSGMKYMCLVLRADHNFLNFSNELYPGKLIKKPHIDWTMGASPVLIQNISLLSTLAVLQGGLRAWIMSLKYWNGLSPSLIAAVQFELVLRGDLENLFTKHGLKSEMLEKSREAGSVEKACRTLWRNHFHILL